MNLKAALAELKKFKEVMEPEAYAEIEEFVKWKMKENKYCDCKPENRLLCQAAKCGYCHSCDKLLPLRKYELPAKFPIGLHSGPEAKINKIIDYLKAKEEK